MPERLLTISEVVDRCSPSNDEHRMIWLRRARELSNLGIFPTAPQQQRAGSGRHRLYKPDVVWLAAVLLRMSDQRAPIGCLRALASQVNSGRRTRAGRDFRQFWQQAKASINFPFPARDFHIAFAEGPDGRISFHRSEGPIWVSDGSWVTTNLSLVFRQLAKPREDEEDAP
jgi:hypothetical protein